MIQVNVRRKLRGEAVVAGAIDLDTLMDLSEARGRSMVEGAGPERVVEAGRLELGRHEFFSSPDVAHHVVMQIAGGRGTVAVDGKQALDRPAPPALSEVNVPSTPSITGTILK